MQVSALQLSPGKGQRGPGSWAGAAGRQAGPWRGEGPSGDAGPHSSAHPPGTQRGCGKARKTRRGRAARAARCGRECALPLRGPPAPTRGAPTPLQAGGAPSRHPGGRGHRCSPLGLLKRGSQSPDVPAGVPWPVSQSGVISVAEAGGGQAAPSRARPADVRVPRALAGRGASGPWPRPARHSAVAGGRAPGGLRASEKWAYWAPQLQHAPLAPASPRPRACGHSRWTVDGPGEEGARPEGLLGLWTWLSWGRGRDSLFSLHTRGCVGGTSFPRDPGALCPLPRA